MGKKLRISQHSLIVITLLLSPYFFIWLLVPQLEYDIQSGWLFPLMSGFRQAFLSGMVSILLGFILSLSLFSCGSLRAVQRMRVILLAPNFIPPLFIILSLMSFTKSFGLSHQGLFWVVILHALINGGLFAVAFHANFLLNLRPQFEVAKVLGAGSLRRFFSIGLPLTLPLLIQNFFLIFAICLVSFSIPLVLSGGSVTSLEVHIYRLVRSEGKWGVALIYSLIQAATVIALASLFWVSKATSSVQQKVDGFRPSFAKPFRILGWLPFLLLSFFWLKDIPRLLFSNLLPQFISGSGIPLLTAAFNSALLFLLVFIFQILLCVVVMSGPFSSLLERFFQGYIAPSVAVLGFALSLLPGQEDFLLLLKTSLCFSLLTFPLLFRWQLLERWRALESQVQVARVLGGTSDEIFWSVTWPQLKSMCFTMALMASVWSLGDFAVSSFFLSGDQTLALMVVDLLNRYQLELATLLSFFLFFVGVVIFYGAQKGLSRVSN